MVKSVQNPVHTAHTVHLGRKVIIKPSGAALRSTNVTMRAVRAADLGDRNRKHAVGMMTAAAAVVLS